MPSPLELPAISCLAGGRLNRCRAAPSARRRLRMRLRFRDEPISSLTAHGMSREKGGG